MKIGITERGDAGLDLSWFDKIAKGYVDGAILVTKSMSDLFNLKVADLYHNGFRNIIVHCTCTGWGASVLEPKVAHYSKQLQQLKNLIAMGFPESHCVLRIDPIIPTDEGLRRVEAVLDLAGKMDIIPKSRIRVSVLDEYNHVKDRFRNIDFDCCYPEGKKFASYKQMQYVNSVLSKYPYLFECCAEPYLLGDNFIQTGCISNTELALFNLKDDTLTANPQNRKGCNCYSCKTELLTNKHRCYNQCAYCYWLD